MSLKKGRINFAWDSDLIDDRFQSPLYAHRSRTRRRIEHILVVVQETPGFEWKLYSEYLHSNPGGGEWTEKEFRASETARARKAEMQRNTEVSKHKG